MKTWQFYSRKAGLPLDCEGGRGPVMSDDIKMTDKKNIPNRVFALFGLVLPAIMVGLDQWSKWATTKFFNQPFDYCESRFGTVPFSETDLNLSRIMDIHLTCNPGISWGLLQGDSPLKRWALTIFAFLMVIVMLYILRRTQDKLGRWALAFVIGGAVGNAIDRLFFGAVTDMIDFGDVGFGFVFNVADSFITVGVIGLFISSWLVERRAKQAAT